jgi:hypothetical protein
MDFSSAPPTDAAAPNMSTYGVPPQLGTPIPGTTGGMPAQGGLSVMKNPMAHELESQGRNGDSMLVHMTPDEVGGLQNLAMAMGGSLTINPETGLPEANFLKKLLPTLLGAGLSFIPGVGPLLAAGIVGGGQTLLTGDINKGLMAGLQAFGGASLGGAAGAGNVFGAKAASSAATAAGTGAGTGASVLPGAYTTPGISGAASQLASAGAPAGAMGLGTLGTSMAPLNAGLGVGGFGTATAGQAAKTGLAGFAQKFGQTASAGLGKGMIAKAAPYVAGASVLDAVNQASMPSMAMPGDENKSIYEGPYLPMPRRIQPRESGPGGEIQFFDKVNPYPGFLTREGKTPRGYAEGGDIDLRTKNHDYLTSTGYMDPVFGQQQLQAGNLTPGSRSSLGGVDFVVNDLGRWVPYTAQAPAQTQQSTNQPPAQQTGSAATGLLGPAPTSTPTPAPAPAPTNTPTPTVTPGSRPLAPGVDVLNTPYTPQFTQLPDFRTPTPQQATLGARSLAALPDVMNAFRTSPGPVTASRNYEGGSPSERLRRNIAGGANPGSRESDFGFAKSSSTGAPAAGVGFSGVGGIFDGGLGSLPAGVLPQSSINLMTGQAPRDTFENYDNNNQEEIYPYAGGGEVDMDNGSFVVDARTVSELGNGSSNAGIEYLSRMGGRPVRGSGDGVSDSVPARIGGSQAARVARDEVIFPAKAVARLGGGNHSKGTQKLYDMMEKAHKARRKASRGQDTKVAKGLGALS